MDAHTGGDRLRPRRHGEGIGIISVKPKAKPKEWELLAPIERILDQYGTWWDRDKTWAWAIVDKPWGEGIIGWGGGAFRSWYTWNEIVGDRIHLKVWFGTYGGTWELWLYGDRLLWATGPSPTEGQLIMDSWYDVPQVEDVSLYYENSDILFAGDTIRFYGYVKGTRTWGNGAYRGLEWRELQFSWGPFEDTLITDRNGKYEVTYEIPWGYSGWYDACATCEGVASTVKSIAIAWNTRISISAPLSVREGQEFDVTGTLEHETGPATWSPLSKEVTVYYNGRNGEIGSVITDADGRYLVTGVIYEKNHYILRAVFAGEELGGVFVAAEAKRDLIVEPPVMPIQWVLLPAVAGVGLVIMEKL